MFGDTIDAKFDEMKSKIKETWGKLTDDVIMLYNGNREQFVEKVKQTYNVVEEDIEKKLKAIEEAVSNVMKGK